MAYSSRKAASSRGASRERLQHDGIEDRVSCRRQRAGEHENRRGQRHAGGTADRQCELADHVVDRVEGILDAHGGDAGRLRQPPSPEPFRLTDRSLAARSGREIVCGAPAKALGENTMTK